MSLSVVLMLMISFLISPLVYAATSVTNSVNVSANSSGGKQENHASVKTVINGKTIESWTSTSSEAITYKHTVTTPTVTTTVESNVDSVVVEPDRTVLVMLIKRLQALIELYVTLYNKN
ncbi:MAG: hypothetical protein RLZZ230_831 [Candidatus Parcubacteria bacterium]